MKTKNVKYLILTLIFSITGLISCEKILDVPPAGKLTFEQYWQSGEHALAAIAGLYHDLGSTASDFNTAGMSATAISPVESYIYWGELRGEILSVNAGKYAADQIEKENVDNLNTSSGDVTTKFTQFYRIINEANQAIKYIPEVQARDPGFITEKELMAEACFIRAFAYFWLARTFKEVPLVLTPSEDDGQDYNIRKSTQKELFDQIEADLTLAVASLPQSYDNSLYNQCRATRYTAYTVLADLYLWRAAVENDGKQNTYYDKVIEYCDILIDSKKYVMVPGISFGSIFLIGNTSESIFEIYANSLLNNQTNNLRGWFTNTGYWVVSTTNDALFEYTIVGDYRATTAAKLPQGPYPEKGTAISVNSSSRYINKYNSTTNDSRWIFYRYPEILLMKAEAIAHRYVDDESRLSQAAALIDQIRARATGVSNYTKVDATSTFEMDQVILDERGREFMGEGKRWFELMRFASRDNFAHKELLTDRFLNAFSGVQQLVMLPRVIDPDGWYLPLNASELAANHNLEQNPYYK